MRLVLCLTLAAIAAIALLACGETEEATQSQTPSAGTPTVSNSDTATPSPSATPTDGPRPTETGGLETYHNDKYGYTVAIPAGWRAATAYMEALAEEASSPGYLADPEDYLALTAADAQAELDFIHFASETPGPALSPWYDFAPGVSIHILPVSAPRQEFLTDIHQGGLTVENTNVREMHLNGITATRLTRREASDNGDFVFDAVYVPFESGGCAANAPTCHGMVLRIEMTAKYDLEAFETVFRSFSDA